LHHHDQQSVGTVAPWEMSKKHVSERDEHERERGTNVVERLELKRVGVRSEVVYDAAEEWPHASAPSLLDAEVREGITEGDRLVDHETRQATGSEYGGQRHASTDRPIL